MLPLPGPFNPVPRNRANQPGPAFPQSPGIILETNSHNLLNRYCLLRSFNELETAYRRFANRQRIDMHSLFTGMGLGKVCEQCETSRQIKASSPSPPQIIHRVGGIKTGAVNKFRLVDSTKTPVDSKNRLVVTKKESHPEGRP